MTNEKAPEKTPGSVEFARFMDQQPRGAKSRAAESLGKSRQWVAKYQSGATRPTLVVAAKLEALTLGAIEVPAWLTPTEAAEVAQIRAKALEQSTDGSSTLLLRSLRSRLRELRRDAEALSVANPPVGRAALVLVQTLQDEIDEALND